MDFSKLGDGDNSTKGSLVAFDARPFGYIPVVARRTANHSALLQTIVKVGNPSARPTKCAAVGTESMYEPSPNAAITWRVGAAIFAPSASPKPRPRPDALPPGM